MKRTGMAAAVAIAAVWGSGCGTVCNFASGNLEPYGGVAKDVEFFQKHPFEPTGGKEGVGAAILLFGEMSLSFVADTLTLPITVYTQHRAYADDERNPSAREDSKPDIPVQFSSDCPAPVVLPLLEEPEPNPQRKGEGQGVAGETKEPVQR
jgi:hypothetical protein